MLKLFHKEIKGHGQGHMFKINGTIEKVLSWWTHMSNMNPLSLTVKKLWPKLKFVIDIRANRWADGPSTSNYYGNSPSGGPQTQIIIHTL